MKNMKLFIWDFDGTLVDTYPYSVRSMQRVLEEHGHAATYAEILEQMMENIPVALEYFTEKFQIPELSDRFWEYQQQGAQNPVVLFEDVLDVLHRIREIGGKNLIFTNRNESIFPMLEKAGIADEFDEVVTTLHPSFAGKGRSEREMFILSVALDVNHLGCTLHNSRKHFFSIFCFTFKNQILVAFGLNDSFQAIDCADVALCNLHCVELLGGGRREQHHLGVVAASQTAE